MQGLGNKFIVLKGPIVLTPNEIVDLCRTYGKDPADGLLIVSPLGAHSVEMKYYNADASLAEMCGNGLRCVARYAVDKKMVIPGEFTVKTDAGPLRVIWDGKNSNNIEVQVGKVSLETNKLNLYGVDLYRASVGNPHAITFVKNIKNAPIKKLGPKIERNKNFPNKSNVEFVQVISLNKIYIRTWERGVGETQACGTGMVAAASVSADQGLARFPLEVKVLGGSASVWIDEEGYSRMIAPAEYI